MLLPVGYPQQEDEVSKAKGKKISDKSVRRDLVSPGDQSNSSADCGGVVLPASLEDGLKESASVEVDSEAELESQSSEIAVVQDEVSTGPQSTQLVRSSDPAASPATNIGEDNPQSADLVGEESSPVVEEQQVASDDSVCGEIGEDLEFQGSVEHIEGTGNVVPISEPAAGEHRRLPSDEIKKAGQTEASNPAGKNTVVKVKPIPVPRRRTMLLDSEGLRKGMVSGL